MIASGFRRVMDAPNRLDFGLDSGMNANSFDYAGDGMDRGLPDFPIQFPGRSDTSTVEDDMKVYRVLRDTKKDIEELQKDLTRLESWSNDWPLKFNTDKCEAMRISKKNDYSSPQYHLWGNQLKAVSEVKDLGIYITSNLSWSVQGNKLRK